MSETQKTTKPERAIKVLHVISIIIRLFAVALLVLDVIIANTMAERLAYTVALTWLAFAWIVEFTSDKQINSYREDIMLHHKFIESLLEDSLRYLGKNSELEKENEQLKKRIEEFEKINIKVNVDNKATEPLKKALKGVTKMKSKVKDVK